MIKNFELFEQNQEADPFGEENYDQKRVVKPIVWHVGDYDIHYALVGRLLIGSYSMPSIEKIMGKKYHSIIGFGQLNFIDEKFKTEEECKEYITNWWNRFVDKIAY